jgi:hypothetical protein
MLEKEPESNVISLLLEGAEGFDFFRQPDFIKDPLLAGSYAVYKKETLIGGGNRETLPYSQAGDYRQQGAAVLGGFVYCRELSLYHHTGNMVKRSEVSGYR